MSTKKKITIVLLALALLGLLLYSFRPQPVAVSLQQVARGPLRVTVGAEGMTRVRERYLLGAPVAAYAPRIGLKVGDPVAQGQVLVVLRPVPPPLLDERSLAQARAAEHEAAASYEYARNELRRIRPLHERGDVSESRLNEAQATAERSLAALRSARALLDYVGGETGGEPPATVPLVAPVDGRVLAVPHESAGTVAAGEVLIAVGDPSDLEVAVDVLSSDAVRIRPGMRVLFERWGGEPVLEGRVRRVEPLAFTKVSALGVEEQRVWVLADFTSPAEQWQALGDRYRVEAGFVLWEAEEVLTVPASALFRQGGEWSVFVARAGRAVRRPVETGHRAELMVEVLSGLSAGEWVIVHPSSEVADGVRIADRAAGD